MSLEVFSEGLRQCKDEGCILENGDGLFVTHWKDYQSEYERQKPYRKKAGEGPQTFEEYVEVLRSEFSDLEIDEELKKFHLWWDEGDKVLKRPKSALRNWLIKAREIKGEKEGRGGAHQRSAKENTGFSEEELKRGAGVGQYGNRVV